MSEPARRDVTTLLDALERGEAGARQEIFALLYEELRERAGRLVREQGAPHSFDATAVVHEAYLRLCGGAGGTFENRAHFLASASKAMRHVLVDHARARGRQKREPKGKAVPLDEVVAIYEERVVDLDTFDLALARMAEFDPDMVRAVELRLFGGVGVDETAKILGLPRRTFERRWQAARAWLATKLA